jgi:hypothetical protein
MKIDGVLTPEDCRLMVEEFDAAASKQIETEAFYQGSIGLYQPPSSLPMVARLEKILAPVYGLLAFENSYLRAYVPSSILAIHTDRPGLDVTLSVCLEHDFAGEYPLWCSRQPFDGPWDASLPNYDRWKTDAEAFELGLGDGAVIEGIRYPHWREAFEYEGRAVYIFFHWRKQRPSVSKF